MKKSERIQIATQIIRASITESRITQRGRFLFQAGNYWALVYKGPIERAILCKQMILANPELISDEWLDANKEKFQANGEELTIKKEFKNFFVWGVTPFRLSKESGDSPRLLTQDRANLIWINSVSCPTSFKPFMA